MCGIAGFIGSFSPELLRSMNDAQSHRGPDDQGVWYQQQDRVGLAHRRLSIVDLSPTGHQPMWDQGQRAVICFNGELYGYKQHAEQLRSEGVSFQGTSDTEVLLNLYLRDGDAFLDKLEGMFAFAIWDDRKKELLLARDPFGVKPLYYAETDKGFIFASELKSLLREPSVSRDIDPQAIYNHLTYLYSPGETTMLKHVRKLKPGHAMVCKDGKIVRQWKYYELPYTLPIQDWSFEEARQKVKDALIESVRGQLIADVPVGAFLSGGLDSSALVALAKRECGTSPECFTIGFNNSDAATEGFTEDLPYAQRVAKDLGVHLNTIYVGPEMANQIEKMIYHLDEPQADPAAINAMMICSLAREKGIKVLLSGAGGDDVFTGYRRHYALMQEKYWGWMPRPTRAGLKAAAGLLSNRSATGRRLNKAFAYADLDEDQRLTRYFNWLSPERSHALLARDVRSALSPRDLDPLAKSLESCKGISHPLNRMLFLEAKHFLCDHNLNYGDKMSMSMGVEVRVPFLDRPLMKVAAQLPIWMKQNKKVGKWILKKAMEEYLPHEVIYRPKTGFGVPLRQWMSHELKDLVGDVLSPDTIRRRGLFDADNVAELLKDDREGKIDAGYTIFALICVELWCRVFLDAGH